MTCLVFLSRRHVSSVGPWEWLGGLCTPHVICVTCAVAAAPEAPVLKSLMGSGIIAFPGLFAQEGDPSGQLPVTWGSQEEWGLGLAVLSAC